MFSYWKLFFLLIWKMNFIVWCGKFCVFGWLVKSSACVCAWWNFPPFLLFLFKELLSVGSGAMEIRDLVALSLIISREQRLELARDNLPSDLEWGITSLLLLLLLLLLLRQLSPTINSSCLNSYHAAHENSLQTFPPMQCRKVRHKYCGFASF